MSWQLEISVGENVAPKRTMLLLAFIALAVLFTACATVTPAPTDEASATPAAAAEGASQGDVADDSLPQALSMNPLACPVELPVGEVEGESIICGEIAVPENWNERAGREIKLTYAIVKASGTDVLDSPIIYFDGGPGISSLTSLSGLSTDFAHLRQNHDLIFWDQRGNIYSSHLDCPDEIRDPRFALSIEELEAQATAQAATPQPTLDPALLEPATLEDDPQAYLARERQLRAFTIRDNNPEANCRHYYAEQGVDLAAYNTANSVRDAVALMGALNYEHYNIYAISYGTTLALEAMRYYDEPHALALPPIRSVVIDGVSPLAVDMAEQSLIRPYNVLRVFDTCEADTACAEAYPDIRQRLLDMLARISDTGLMLNDGTQINIEDLTGLLTLVASSDPEGWRYLPRLVAELEQNDGSTYTRLQARASAPVPIGILAMDELDLDLSAAINCNDRSATLDVERAFAIYRSFAAPQLITDFSPVVGQIIKCESWELMAAPDALPNAVTSDIRTLVVNGGMDAQTAVEWGEAAFATLPNAEMITYPLSPHGASVQSECAHSVTATFFAAPNAALDLACVEEMKPQFALPDDALPLIEPE